jgi:thiamine-monophosphate kinase
MADESNFIALLRGLAADPVARGLADDCAVLGDLVFTHDMMVAGRHWLPDADPADVAWKLVASNYSDLAAKGAAPVGVLMGYMLGDDAWDRRFVDGLSAAIAAMGGALWGGDTVAGGANSVRSIGLTAIGRAGHKPVPSRTDATPGQSLWVTGCIGAAFAGFRHDAERKVASEAEIARFRRPTPRTADGIALAAQVGAMMDVSDGLLLDAARMADASSVTIAIDRTAVPLSPSVAQGTLADQALRWGDDYELLFTLPDGVSPAAVATRIGTVLPRGVEPLLVDGMPPSPDRALGYLHDRPV